VNTPEQSTVKRQSNVLLTLAALAGTAVLIGLGVWQLQRMSWKNNVLERIETLSAHEPVALSDALERFAGGEDLRYVTVSLSGRFLHHTERHLYWLNGGEAGWRIITALAVDGPAVVMVDRGFVPLEFKHPDARPQSHGGAPVSFVAQILGDEEQAMFTPDNDLVRNEWYWRDLDTMTAELTGEEAGAVAPFVVAAVTPSSEGALPEPLPLELSAISNNHFHYALTWFGLAAALLAVYGVFARARRRA
jgi:surfeit locus 1 family protein